jgi:DNA-binding NarL/FixJ family response regulator
VIRSALESRGVEVIGVAGDAREAVQVSKETRPDLVLIDLGLPDESGIVAGKRIIEDLPETKVLAVTALNDAKVVGDALRAGFCGYLTKDTTLAKFMRQIEDVVRGDVVVPHRIAAGTTPAVSAEERNAKFLASQLSPRELEVLTILAEGADSATISRRLRISPNTVRTHVQSILMKLQVHSRLEAATFAVRYGLVSVRGRASG